MLTQAMLREILDYSPETGVFVWRVKPSGPVSAGTMAGSMHIGGYICIKVNKRLYKAHRLAWLYERGEWPASEMDHINGDRSDNRIANLRVATRTENQQNRSLNRNNTSGYRGVSWNRTQGKWMAVVSVDGKKVHGGKFNDPETAYAAVLAIKRQHHTFQPVPRDF